MMTGYMIVGVLVLLGIFGYLRRPSQGPVVGANKMRLRRMNAQSTQATATDFQWKEWVKLGDLWAYFTPRTGGPQWPILTLATAVLLLVFKDFFFPEGKGVLAPIFWAGIIVIALCSVMLFGSWEDNQYRRLLSLLLFGSLVWFVLRHTNLIYESPTEQKVAQALSLQLNRELEPVEKRAEELRLKAETEGLTSAEIAELKGLPDQETLKRGQFPDTIPRDKVLHFYEKITAQLVREDGAETTGKRLLAAGLVAFALLALVATIKFGGIPVRVCVVILAIGVLGYLWGFRLERSDARMLVATPPVSAMTEGQFIEYAERLPSGGKLAYVGSVNSTSTSHFFRVKDLGLEIRDAQVIGPQRYEIVGQLDGGIDCYRGQDFRQIQIKGCKYFVVNNNDPDDPVRLEILFKKG